MNTIIATPNILTVTPDLASEAFRTDAMPLDVAPELTYSGLLKVYAESDWGVHHAGQPLRYARHFGYDRLVMLNDLGDDVHPVGHMRVVHEDVVRLGLESLVGKRGVRIADPTEIALVRAGALVHDAGESTHPELEMLCGGVIGDIPHGGKTPADRALEWTLLETVTGKLHAGLPEWFRARMLDIVTHREDSEAHQLLEAAHTWGFYCTALRAGSIALSERQVIPDGRLEALKGLAKVVSRNSRPELEAFVTDFPSLERRLDASDKLYDEIATL